MGLTASAALYSEQQQCADYTRACNEAGTKRST